MNISLPNDLSERVRRVSERQVTGEFVLLWLHNALRLENNPSVNVAIEAANQLGLPLLVYQGVSERYPFASDRHHAFILQGARDLQRQCNDAGLPYVLHVERRSDKRPHLRELTRRAALLVTDDMPTAPAAAWIARLAQLETTVWAVDSACVVPMPLGSSAPTRAFEFRKKTTKQRNERLQSQWTPPQLERSLNIRDVVDFEPVSIDDVDLAALIAECDIDHAVGPVPHTIGGRDAGLARWQAFREQRLIDYARDRNDALLDSVSRMSAYLHYGMVSPFDLVVDCLDAGEGGEKYLDELLIWRELAYHFCHHQQHHETIAALPDWAIATLGEHESDVRDRSYSWESLARAATADDFWNAAQRSLLVHGELHNNVRMTWGKAIVGWSPDAAAALKTLIDLNHRYALDGRDPASYGGLLWCLGQFDRPFKPPEPIFGTVRSRSTAIHAQRLNTQQYSSQTARPLVQPTPRVAVIGGGMTGLIAARTLVEHGLDVTVFDRGRRLGGRVHTRQNAYGPFDFGAPSFEVSSSHAQKYVDAWHAQRLVEKWTFRALAVSSSERIETRDHWVAVPTMAALVDHLADGIPIRTEADVASAALCDAGVDVRTDNGEQRFDFAIIAMPPEQAGRVAPIPSSFAPSRPAHVAMVAIDRGRFERPAEWIDFKNDPIIASARCESAKPGRTDNGFDCWTVESTPEWSAGQLETGRDDVANILSAQFCKLVQLDPIAIANASSHRWTFARTAANQPDCHSRPELHLQGNCLCFACAPDGVEQAIMTGINAAGTVLRRVFL